MEIKHALVVAGGQWQVPLIQELKQFGYIVTVVDPYDNSKGVLVADYHIKSDVRDKDYILSKIKENYKIVATDQSDISVETVAFLSQELGILGNKIDAVRKFSNKYISRQYAQSIDIPIPIYCEVDSCEQIEVFIQNHGGEFILKPSDAQSSKGIHLVDEKTPKENIISFLQDALSYSFTKKAILERFVKGYEITVEGFCSNGSHQVLAISKKKHFKTGIASCLTYPGDIPQEIKKNIIDCDNRYVEQSGLSFGPTHAEYIIDELSGEFWLVEIACRGGGTLISSDIVQWVSGFDIQKAYIQSLEGKVIDVKSIVPKENAAELHFFEFGEGNVVDIKGVDEVKNMDGVLMLDIPIKVGDRLSSCVDDRSRHGFVIVVANTREQLMERLTQVNNKLKISLHSDK